MSVQIGNHSRLRFADLLTTDGVEFWDVVDLPEIPVQTDDVVHEVSGPTRIDTLAVRYYGDPVLWWVIAVANGFEDLPTQLVEGSTLRIPSPRYVLQEFFSTANVK